MLSSSMFVHRNSPFFSVSSAPSVLKTPVTSLAQTALSGESCSCFRLATHHSPLVTAFFTLLHFPKFRFFLFNHFRTLLLFQGGGGAISHEFINHQLQATTLLEATLTKIGGGRVSQPKF